MKNILLTFIKANEGMKNANNLSNNNTKNIIHSI